MTILLAHDVLLTFSGSIRYSIVNGDPLGQFLIDSSSGTITLANVLDRETINSYTLSVS